MAENKHIMTIQNTHIKLRDKYKLLQKENKEWNLISVLDRSSEIWFENKRFAMIDWLYFLEWSSSCLNCLAMHWSTWKWTLKGLSLLPFPKPK